MSSFTNSYTDINDRVGTPLPHMNTKPKMCSSAQFLIAIIVPAFMIMLYNSTDIPGEKMVLWTPLPGTDKVANRNLHGAIWPEEPVLENDPTVAQSGAYTAKLAYYNTKFAKARRFTDLERQLSDRLIASLDPVTKSILFPDPLVLRDSKIEDLIERIKLKYPGLSMPEMQQFCSTFLQPFEGPDMDAWRRHTSMTLTSYVVLQALGMQRSESEKVLLFTATLQQFRSTFENSILMYLNVSKGVDSLVTLIDQLDYAAHTGLAAIDTPSYANKATTDQHQDALSTVTTPPAKKPRTYNCHSHGPNTSHNSDKCLHRAPGHNVNAPKVSEANGLWAKIRAARA